jgi:hypothetical protein
MARVEFKRGDTVASDVLIARWSEIGDKIVKLAEEFPEDQYDFHPVSGVRSFADQLRHVAFWNMYVRKTIRREEADGEANELPRDTYPSKALILPALRKSFQEVKTEVVKKREASNGSDLDVLVTFIEHNGEHYGQMVVYYRLKGLGPPASRGGEQLHS